MDDSIRRLCLDRERIINLPSNGRPIPIPLTLAFWPHSYKLSGVDLSPYSRVTKGILDTNRNAFIYRGPFG